MKLPPLLIVLCCAGCVSQPAQQSDWRYEDGGPASDYQLIRLTADVLQGLNSGVQNGISANTALDKALGDYQYRVGANDVLTFTVWDHPELTIPAGGFRSPEVQGHLVAADGTIFFPYVGNVPVMGKTLVEIRQLITDRLSRYIQNPQLDVRVASFRSKRVNVVGAVGAPGYIPITDIPLTVVDAINLAGGATNQSSMQQVQLLRDNDVQVLNLLALLENGDLMQNRLLSHGDVVYLPENLHYSVHVLGSLANPGPVPIVGGRLNLADAISQTGGFDQTNANKAQVLVFRQDGTQAKVYLLDARKPDALLLATQFRLQPQDVVYVEDSGLAKWNRMISLILPTIQTLWQTQNFIDRSND